MACAICEVRRPKRHCPGVRGEICTICCGTERENSVDCPLECAYLQDAHRHEKLPPVAPDTIPNLDIEVTEAFLRDHEPVLVAIGGLLLAAAVTTSGVNDNDIREALDSLIKTYRAGQSGIIYESLPANPLAAAIHRRVQTGLAEMRNLEAEETGIHKTRDADILGVLAFMQRLEYDRNNGRPRSKGFLDLLQSQFLAAASPDAPQQMPGSSLIIP